MKASNDRNWRPNMARCPEASLDGDVLTIRNIRHCTYTTENDYSVAYHDRSYCVGELESLDFIVVPFKETKKLAHTMISFGFSNGRYVAVSAEVRLEQGQSYSPVWGALRQYELMYVVADERDVIPLRTRHRQMEVYLYRTLATADQAQRILMDVVRRINQLAERPEFYHTLRNNCTTSIVRHINGLFHRRVPWRLGVLLPGYSDRLAYNLNLIDTSAPFEEIRSRALVKEVDPHYEQHPDYSKMIRRQAV